MVEGLQSLSCVPRHYLFGKHGNKDVLVMELLSGEDMSALRLVIWCVGIIDRSLEASCCAASVREGM